jgi:hypothetical protein
MKEQEWIKSIIWVMVVYALTDTVLLIFHLTSTPQDTVGISATAIGVVLAVLLAVTLSSAHDKNRPSLYLVFLVLNGILILCNVAALVLYVLGQISISTLFSSRLARSNQVVLFVLAVLGFILPLVNIAGLIFFETVVYRVWRASKETEVDQQQYRSVPLTTQ